MVNDVPPDPPTRINIKVGWVGKKKQKEKKRNDDERLHHTFKPERKKRKKRKEKWFIENAGRDRKRAWIKCNFRRRRRRILLHSPIARSLFVWNFAKITWKRKMMTSHYGLSPIRHHSSKKSFGGENNSPPPPNQVFWGTRFDIQRNNIVLLAIKSDWRHIFPQRPILYELLPIFSRLLFDTSFFTLLTFQHVRRLLLLPGQ